jgi:hypothetical protein
MYTHTNKYGGWGTQPRHLTHAGTQVPKNPNSVTKLFLLHTITGNEETDCVCFKQMTHIGIQSNADKYNRYDVRYNQESR